MVILQTFFTQKVFFVGKFPRSVLSLVLLIGLIPVGSLAATKTDLEGKMGINAGVYL